MRKPGRAKQERVGRDFAKLLQGWPEATLDTAVLESREAWNNEVIISSQSLHELKVEGSTWRHGDRQV